MKSSIAINDRLVLFVTRPSSAVPSALEPQVLDPKDETTTDLPSQPSSQTAANTDEPSMVTTKRQRMQAGSIEELLENIELLYREILYTERVRDDTC